MLWVSVHAAHTRIRLFLSFILFLSFSLSLAMRPALFDAARAEIYFRNSILILFTVTMAKTVVRKNLSQMQQKRALFSHFDGNECKWDPSRWNIAARRWCWYHPFWLIAYIAGFPKIIIGCAIASLRPIETNRWVIWLFNHSLIAAINVFLSGLQISMLLYKNIILGSDAGP